MFFVFFKFYIYVEVNCDFVNVFLSFVNVLFNFYSFICDCLIIVLYICVLFVQIYVI